MRYLRPMSVYLAALTLLGAALAWASITGSISGIVTDPSGAVVSGATVVATDLKTGITNSVVSDGRGFYSFPSLPVGSYSVKVSLSGFKTFTKSGLVIDANSALRADAALQLGTASEKIEVSTDTVHVETQSTQMGDVITGKSMTAVPLDGRAIPICWRFSPGYRPTRQPILERLESATGQWMVV